MKITKRQLRRIIKEAWQAEREHYYSTDKPRGASTFAADFINPDHGSIKEYLSLAVQLGLQVTTNTPKMLTVQGSKDALIEFGAILEEMEGGPNIRGGAGFDEQGLINAMRPITEGQHKGTPLEQMPAAWRQVLGGCLTEYGAPGDRGLGWADFQAMAQTGDYEGAGQWLQDLARDRGLTIDREIEDAMIQIGADEYSTTKDLEQEFEALTGGW